MGNFYFFLHYSYWYSRKLTEDQQRRTYMFDSFFYTSLTNKKTTDSLVYSKSKIRHERVKKWTKKVNLFEKDFIFIPINEW